MAQDGGLSRIQQRLNAIPNRVRQAAAAAAEPAAELIAGDMRHFALSSKATGALIDSITVTPAGQSTPPYSQPGGSTVVPEGAAMITAGNSDVRYPHLIEYGWSKGQAQPFFWPAVRANRKRVLAKINRDIRKAIKAEWGKS